MGKSSMHKSGSNLSSTAQRYALVWVRSAPLNAHTLSRAVGKEEKICDDGVESRGLSIRLSILRQSGRWGRCKPVGQEGKDHFCRMMDGVCFGRVWLTDFFASDISHRAHAPTVET